MKVLSINISIPRKIIFNGKTVNTSIFKKPINEKVKITKLGINGDKQADLSAHGGKNKSVYVYSYSHYKYWGKILNKNFSKEYGLVGENLTIDDFNEKDYFIGDEIQIANTVLKITQPRIPCYKLGIKMNEKKFIKYFIDHAHLGMYMKVIKSGEIEKNDNVELIHREKNSMSVYDVSKLIFNEYTDVSKIKKALSMSYLSEEIKTRLTKTLVKLGHYEFT